MFSKREQKVIDIIGNKKITITEVVEKYYGESPIPFNANNSIAYTVRRVASKCEHNDLNWTLAGEGIGRGGKTVWKAKR